MRHVCIRLQSRQRNKTPSLGRGVQVNPAAVDHRALYGTVSCSNNDPRLSKSKVPDLIHGESPFCW